MFSLAPPNCCVHPRQLHARCDGVDDQKTWFLFSFIVFGIQKLLKQEFFVGFHAYSKSICFGIKTIQLFFAVQTLLVISINDANEIDDINFRWLQLLILTLYSKNNCIVLMPKHINKYAWNPPQKTFVLEASEYQKQWKKKEIASFGHPHQHIARVIDAGVRNNWEEPTRTLAYYCYQRWIAACFTQLNHVPRITQSAQWLWTRFIQSVTLQLLSAVYHIYDACTFTFHWLVMTSSMRIIFFCSSDDFWLISTNFF